LIQPMFCKELHVVQERSNYMAISKRLTNITIIDVTDVTSGILRMFFSSMRDEG